MVPWYVDVYQYGTMVLLPAVMVVVAVLVVVVLVVLVLVGT